MNAALHDACRHALKHNLGLRRGERVVIVTDHTRPAIAAAFEQAAGRQGALLSTVAVPVAAANGQEPGRDAAQAMGQGEVVLLLTEKSLSWTRARVDATDGGARVASMTSISEEILLRTLTVDYEPVREEANRLCDCLDAGSSVRILSARGTDLQLSIAGRIAHGRKGGIFREPGHWGNLPCGEAFIAPVEGTANGAYVVDGSHAGLGRVTEPVRITVQDGMATRFEGGSNASRLQAILESTGSPQAFNIAEFGIGCNHAARVTGTILEDEKARDTCHIALGNNIHFGGTVDVPIHLDGIILNPDIAIE
jgi:leucyl aminopeptidase (aminopeptidase T)